MILRLEHEVILLIILRLYFSSFTGRREILPPKCKHLTEPVPVVLCSTVLFTLNCHNGGEADPFWIIKGMGDEETMKRLRTTLRAWFKRNECL